MSVRECISALESQSNIAGHLSSISTDQSRLEIPQLAHNNSRTFPQIARNTTVLQPFAGGPESYQIAPFSDEEKRLILSRDTANLLAPPLPARTQSSDGRLQTSRTKSPPPVPSKSTSLVQRLNTLQLAKEPCGKLPKFSRFNSTNIAASNLDHRSPIILVDHELGQDVDYASLKSGEPRIEVAAHSDADPEVALQQVKGQSADFPRKLLVNVQDFVKAGPPKISEFARKISQTADPLLNGAKENLDKAVLTAKPVVTEAGRGLTKALVQTGVKPAFIKTQSDVLDAAAKLKGKDGLCTKCQTLSVDKYLSETATKVIGPPLEWATPLSRIIYHADWCRVCRLLLDILCESRNDPLKHPAVAPYVQPELKGRTMKDWIKEGWGYTDRNWPFGNGAKRHEGVTYVGPAAKRLGTVLATGAVVVGMSVINPNPQRRRNVEQSSRYRKHRPALYPLSCVVRITANKAPKSESPAMLSVRLLGYGRKLGAELQILSNFHLRAVSTTLSSALNIVPLSQSQQSSGIFSYGRTLDPDWIDLSVGRLWLQECESRHGSECSQHGWAVAMQNPSFLRVVDIDDFCIKEVANPARCRFIALSYVWGRAEMVKLQYKNIDKLTKKNGLLEYRQTLPQTIVDAIEVVKGVGERYLWVDALCILQENTKEALEQIAHMDRVYGSALATIIAVQGKTAHAGLEGIRPRYTSDGTQRLGRQRYLNQVGAKIKDNISIIAPLPITSHNVDASVWNDRAWTFQERFLSRRLITFSHGQMVWHCRKMICREDMTVADSKVSYTPLQWLSLKPRYLGVNVDRNWIDGSIEITRHGATKLVRSATFAEYAKVIEQYTSRQMSYQSDILNAFAGLSHIFELCFKCRMLYGLPQNLLDVAIMWRPTQKLVRRSGFPSWSWSGWEGRVTYDRPFKVTRAMDGSFRSFAVEANGEEGVRPMIRWHVWDASSHRVVPINLTGLGFPFEGAAFPDEWENHPYYMDNNGNGGPRRVAAVPAHKPVDDSKTLDQSVIFWASSSSKFRVGKAIIQGSDQQWNSAMAPYRYRLLDTYSNVVGNVLLDGVDNNWMHRGRYEFIQLAETYYFGLDKEPKDVEDCPLYLVMLVEWNKQLNVAYRLGLGRVQKTAWMLATPNVKLVCLA